ncbi:MAG: DNA replication and repair protein RecF [Dehalococcoidia bacterium]|nr:DNA replication and repair protein RecF [Dehalococcoidia bacterium]MDW8119504.1 DNA replication and repair protein RecF [Chloroflexota bacterium]
MRLIHLSVRNIRTYRSLEVDFPRGLTLIWGANAQGKTNLLETVYLLALTKSPRTPHDQDLLSFWAAEEDGWGYVEGTFQRRNGGRLTMRVDLLLRPSGEGLRGTARPFQKQVRLNGVVCPASQAVGQAPMVLFQADDIDMVLGPPALRRRWLDILLSLTDRRYLLALQRYQRLLAHRNRLLKAGADPDQTAYWDKEVCTEGGRITAQRLSALQRLAPLIAAAYSGLAGMERVEVSYRWAGEGLVPLAPETIASTLARQMEALHPRERALGQTLVGPHRDDILLRLQGREASFASRGQARSLALALRLAEARFLEHTLHETPILLLDDALSELDVHRRRLLLEAVQGAEQVVLTSTQREEDLPAGCTRFRLEGGRLLPDA